MGIFLMLICFAALAHGYIPLQPSSTFCIHEPAHHFLNRSHTLELLGAKVTSTKWIGKYAIVNEVSLPMNKSAIVKYQLLRAKSHEGWEVRIGRRLKTVQSVPMSQWEYEQRQHRLISKRVTKNGTIKVPRHLEAATESFFMCGNYSRRYDFGVSVMEHMSSLDLWDYALDDQTYDSLVHLEAFTLQAAHALHILHALGVHHGDYHSKNIMILNTSTYEVGVIDFSFSHIYDSAYEIPCKDIYDDVLDFVYDMYHLNTTRTMFMLDIYRRVVCNEMVHICKDWYNATAIQALRAMYTYDFCELKLLEFHE